jgi:uncharacterized protein (DUF362 family)
MLRAALDALPDPPAVAAAERIVVKPNIVSTLRPLAATHVDALRAVLLWLRDRGARQVVVAEGAATEATFDGFAAYGYFALAQLPGLRVDFVDLNQDEPVPVTVFDRHLQPRTIHLARTMVESDLRISVTRPKTHDAVVVTGALKNALMGSPLNRVAGGPRWRARLVQGLLGLVPARFRSIQGLESLRPGLLRRLYPSDKAQVHAGTAVINLNLYLLARVVRPHLGVLDGLIGMEGNGPVYGRPIQLGWAAAGRDAVAVDAVMAHLMGHDPARVGYLHYCHRAGLGVADLAAIEVVGPPLAGLQRLCRPSSTHLDQIGWAEAAVERLFESLMAERASPAA